MKKRIVCIVMLVVILASSLSSTAFAATSKHISIPSGTSWSSNVKCTLKKNIFGKVQNGKVRVTMDNWGVNLDIRMCNGSKTIWSENNALKYSSKAVASVYRDFSLGNDHTYYNLSFRCNKKALCPPSVTVKNLSNCTIS